MIPAGYFDWEYVIWIESILLDSSSINKIFHKYIPRTIWKSFHDYAAIETAMH